MEKRRVVITGMGAVTPIGHTAQESWEAVKRGACGIGPITRYDASGSRIRLAAEVKNLDIDDWLDRRESRKFARFTQLALIAAQQAVQSARFDIAAEDASRCGVIISSGIGGLDVIEEGQTRGLERGFDRTSPLFIPMVICNMAAGNVAIAQGFRGMCSCAVTACASGSNAVGDAMRHIRDGYADVMLCGGTEATITPLAIGAFGSMKALTPSQDPARASIPFDAERSGFVLGEGAGVLLIEEMGHALRRGAPIVAEIVGYGANCDAHHITAPLPDGSGAAACMRLALDDAGVRPEQVGYINAHGTSTKLNDAAETLAIRTAFGAHADKLAVSSTKGATGHLLGAAGGVEAVFTALALHDGFLPPTIHYSVPDPACDLDVVPNVGRACALEYAMSNSLGFGGHNACLLLRRWEA